MNSLFRKLVVGLVALCVSVGSIAQGAGGGTGGTGTGTGDSTDATGQVSDKVAKALCTGSIFNPISDPDWNNVYPITVFGIKMTNKGRSDPPLMGVSPVCVCPTYLFGFPFVGIGVSYWEPVYVAETEHRPGCSASLGGTQLLSGKYAFKRSEEADEASETGQTNLKHMHWYEYPVFSLLEWFKNYWCHTANGYNLLYMTEIDPTWMDDSYAAMLAPEATLFSSPLAQAACIIDAVAANVWYPLDPLFWCAGSWGGVYPLSGNIGITNGLNQVNNLNLAKFIARNARLGLGWQTIGPTAQCGSHINPIWIKSQYRINQIGPIVRKGNTQTIGDLGLFQWPPVANYPATGEYTTDLVWQGQQCCLKIIP